MGDLVIFHKQLGDTVLLEPTLRKIALASGQPAQLLCPAALRPLLELMPHTQAATGKRRWMPDRLWAYDWGGRTTRASAVTFCREKHLLIPNSDWVTRSHRAIFSHVHAVPYRDRYIAQYTWEETRTPDREDGFEAPVLERPPEAWTRDGLCPDEPFLLFNPVSAWQRKCYEPAKWAPALQAAHDLGLKRILMTGGMEPWHYEHCAQIARSADVALTDISGMTNLPEFMHLISRARMVMCVDGAASHLARGFSVPCVTLFGPSYRWMWHLDDPRHVAVDASQFSDEPRPPTQVVPPEAVVEAVRQAWAASQTPDETPAIVLPQDLREGITGRLIAGRRAL